MRKIRGDPAGWPRRTNIITKSRSFQYLRPYNFRWSDHKNEIFHMNTSCVVNRGNCCTFDFRLPAFSLEPCDKMLVVSIHQLCLRTCVSKSSWHIFFLCRFFIIHKVQAVVVFSFGVLIFLFLFVFLSIENTFQGKGKIPKVQFVCVFRRTINRNGEKYEI